MHEVTVENAADYLRAGGYFGPDQKIEVRALGWGVSNVVMRVDVAGQAPFVLKQARERLRTEAHWVSRLDRIWIERAAMEWLGKILPEGSVPKIVFADEENYLFAMTHAPLDAVVWKERLLAGETDNAVAQRAGELLATIHTTTRNQPGLQGRLAETEVFDQLRIDPFYRTVARAHPSISSRIAALIGSMPHVAHPCLVLADFSPKNMLVHSKGLTLVDFETAHAGDPAFDLGFFLSHLILKAVRAARISGEAAAAPYLELIATFREAYESRIPGDDLSLERRASAHAAACSLARVDGTSPVDYLDLPARAAVRRFALASLGEGFEEWDRFIERTKRELTA